MYIITTSKKTDTLSFRFVYCANACRLLMIFSKEFVCKLQTIFYIFLYKYKIISIDICDFRM